MNIGQRNKISAQGNMSSMTDLVFLLLVFFIILSTQVVNAEKVNLPSSQRPESIVGGSITLTITEDMRYKVNDAEVTKEQIENRVAILMEERDAENRKIILNIDASVPTGDTIEILGMCKVNDWEAVVAAKTLSK
jgi:biopolymer transport protein ExbD